MSFHEINTKNYNDNNSNNSSDKSSPRYIKRDNTTIDLAKLTTELFEKNYNPNDLLNDIAVSDASKNSKATTVAGMVMINKALTKDAMVNLTPTQVCYRILKLLKKLENIKHKKYSLYEFIDMIRDLVYNDVSLILIEEYKRKCRVIPKNHYLHYYVYFLHYADYYHSVRIKTNRDDPERREFHINKLKNIKEQIKYMHSIIETNKKVDQATKKLNSTKIKEEVSL